MAAGFKQATVNASKVPSTQTNFPAYVDLSRLGITTLAEAQSARVYSDSAKTTELPREIVSATEMHVKVSSLTSTFVLYVDWDGIRSDYAVTDTYGRNAVWGDYDWVFHFESDAVNSTGNAAKNGTVTNISYSGGAAEFTRTGVLSTSSKIIIPSGDLQANGAFFGRFQNDSPVGTTHYPVLLSGTRIGVRDYIRAGLLLGSTQYINNIVRDDNKSVVSTLNVSDIYNNSLTWSTLTTWFGYWNGSKVTIGSGVRSPVYSGYALGLGCIMNGTSYWNNSSNLSYMLDGRIWEARLRHSAVDENWCVTENANWEDEAGFWGTWSDVGGGASIFIPKVSFIG